MLAEDPGHTKGQERSLQNQVGPKKEKRKEERVPTSQEAPSPVERSVGRAVEFKRLSEKDKNRSVVGRTK